MYKKTAFLLLFVLSLSSAVHAQTIYYCVKNGKKVVTDQGCSSQGASEQKRVQYQEMPPLNTSEALTPAEVKKGQEIDQRMRQEQVADDAQRKLDIAAKKRDDEQARRVCLDLDRYKQTIIAQQRMRNNEYWNSEHRRVNDEIYRRQCETL